MFLTRGKDPQTGPRTFVIFGVMRGGTTMVAGVLRGLGLDLGPQLNENNQESELFANRPIPQMREALQLYNSTHDVWGWKFPNAADYLDRLWNDIRNPHLICVFRDTVANAQALNRWHPIGPSHAMMEVALRHQKNINLMALRGCPTAMISYEKAILNPDAFVAQLSDWTGVHTNLHRFDYQNFMAPGSYKDVRKYIKTPLDSVS